MKKIILSIFALCTVSISSIAQTYDWVKQIEGDNTDQIISISSNGANIYSTGGYNGITDFNPGIGTDIQSTVGGNDVFVQKLDENGDLLWAKSIGGMGEDLGRIINDYGTTIIVSGTFSQTVDFDPGAGVESKTSNGGTDVFILALDDNGDFLWVKTMGGPANESIGGQALNSSNDIIVTGGFNDNMTVDVDGAPVTISSEGGLDVFFMQMDITAGAIDWLKTVGSTGGDSGAGLVVKANDNILITGRYQNIMDIDPSANDFSLSSDGGYSVFLIEYDNQGDFVNGFSFDSSSDMEAYDIELDDNENIYLTGYFKATVDFDVKAGITNISSNGGQDCYVVKLTSMKNLVWAINYGGIGLDQSFGLEVASNGDVYTVGRYSNVVDFDPGTGVANETADGSSFDIFIHKLNSLGDFGFVNTFGEAGSDLARGLALDNNGNMYVGGIFGGIIDFNPSTGITELTAEGPADGFLIKYSNLNVGLNSLDENSTIVLYPNPVNSDLHVVSNNTEITGVEIIDLTGKVIRSIHNNTNSIDVSDLNQGVYILSVHAQNGISNTRFVKQ
jgi:hypothetical protein